MQKAHRSQLLNTSILEQHSLIELLDPLTVPLTVPDLLFLKLDQSQSQQTTNLEHLIRSSPARGDRSKVGGSLAQAHPANHDGEQDVHHVAAGIIALQGRTSDALERALTRIVCGCTL